MDNSILAKLDLGLTPVAYTDRLEKLIPTFKSVARALQLPWAVLAGIASRESQLGALLDENGYGDSGHAFGIMQIDVRENEFVLGKPDPCSTAHITQAASHLLDFFHEIALKFKNWPLEWQLRGAIAAYNFGCGNVQTQSGIDEGTTDNNYSLDVWKWSAWIAANYPD